MTRYEGLELATLVPVNLDSGRCHVHVDRAGLGICVECRVVICSECTTPFEGINRCAACLEARLAQQRTLAARNDWSVSGVVWGLASVGVLFCGFYACASLLEKLAQ